MCVSGATCVSVPEWVDFESYKHLSTQLHVCVCVGVNGNVCLFVCLFEITYSPYIKLKNNVFDNLQKHNLKAYLFVPTWYIDN